ncbi:hypothetical protein BsWGS_01142 [Bradybaena similaris]
MSPPDRWEEYRPMGSVIPGTKFLAFKVPLKEALLGQMKEEDRFSPAILMKLVGDQGLKLGGIIDLTFTFRYYDRQEFLKNSIEHKKIFTPGHAVPSESVFQQFAHAVKTLDTGDNDHIIGVHCTHGVNRTGYLICRYMIEEMSYEPDVAISLFGKARGHLLERENYLEDLKTRKCGHSTYDPNFKVPDEEIKSGGYQGPRKEKPRWRHRREDHPDWRRQYHDSAEKRGIKDEPFLYSSPLDGQRLPHQKVPGFIYGGAYEMPHSIYSQGTGYPGCEPVCPVPSQYLEEGRPSEYKSMPEHFNPGRINNGYPVDRSIQDNSHTWRDNADGNSYNRSWGDHGKRRGYHSGYHSQRFNPIYNYTAPRANRGRRDEHSHNRKDSLITGARDIRDNRGRRDDRNDSLVAEGRDTQANRGRHDDPSHDRNDSLVAEARDTQANSGRHEEPSHDRNDSLVAEARDIQS